MSEEYYKVEVIDFPRAIYKIVDNENTEVLRIYTGRVAYAVCKLLNEKQAEITELKKNN